MELSLLQLEKSSGSPFLLQTERMQVRKTAVLSKLCHLAKNLYNLGNYTLRQEFSKTGRWIRYNKLYHLLKNTGAYKDIPAKSSQGVLRLLEKNWASFFAAIKDWKENPGKYTGRPRIPRYKPEDGESIMIFNNQQCKNREGFLRFPQIADIDPIKTRVMGELHEVRILPRGNHYIVEIVYEREVEDPGLDKNRMIAIDHGLVNLVTVVNNAGLRPWRVKGGAVKSINQYYNKARSGLHSIKDKQGCRFQTKRLQRLTLKRNNKIIDFFHKTSRKIVDYCIENDFGTIITGYNAGWKQEINPGKRTNQNFVNIPFLKLVKQVQYKAELGGIDVILVDESHTSMCSFLDGETVEHHDRYLGKRITRGLFRSAGGTIIQSDVNGSYNIGKKAVPEAFSVDGIEGAGLHPCSVMV